MTSASGGGTNLISSERRANARNVSFGISVRWPIHIINPVDKTTLSFQLCFEMRLVPPPDADAIYSALDALSRGVVSFPDKVET